MEQAPELTNDIEGALAGISVNGGIVTAPAVIFTQEMPNVPIRTFTNAEQEFAKLKHAIAEVKQHLEAQAKLPHGEIFAAHAMMLADPEIATQAEAKVAAELIAEQAWMDVMMALAAQYQAAESQYMREREADVYDICRQVMLSLTGEKPKAITIEQPSVLLARDLMPSDVAGLDKSKVVAICLSEGGKTSHSAILARAMGIPAIVKVQGCLEQVKAGDNITVDGFSGLLWFAPTQAVQEELNSKRHEWLAAQEVALQNAQSQAVTQDGTSIHALANIGGPEDVEAALAMALKGLACSVPNFCSKKAQNYQQKMNNIRSTKRLQLRLATSQSRSAVLMLVVTSRLPHIRCQKRKTLSWVNVACVCV